MLNAILVFVGGGLGALGRWGVGALLQRAFPVGWQWGTLTVNVLGSLAMGVLAGYLLRNGQMGGDKEQLRLFLGTGILGGFTTFSAFSLETAKMMDAGAWTQALGYSTASFVLCVGAVLLGMALTRLSG